MKRFLLFSFSLLSFFCLRAETGESSWKLGIDFGVDFLRDEELRNTDMIRWSGYVAWAECTPWHLSIMPEYMFANNRLGVATGLRVTNYNAVIDGGPEFYWVVKDEPKQTDIVGLKAVEQSNLYLGIPLELRAFFCSQEKFFRPYMKAGLSFSFLVASNNGVVFDRPSMESKYLDKICEDLGRPSVFNSQMELAIGFRLGRENFFTNFELHLPNVRLTDNPASFYNGNRSSIANAGLQVSFQFPFATGKSKSDSSTKAEESADLQSGNTQQNASSDALAQ